VSRVVTTRRAALANEPLPRLGWASKLKPWAVAGPLLCAGFLFLFSFIFLKIHINFKNA
jgi:hypothetical protein